MKKALVLSAILGALGLSSPAFSEGVSANTPGKNAELLIQYYTVGEPTGSPTPSGTVTNLGQALSGGYYGNTSNAGIDSDAPARGHGVTPSCSPGPQIGGCDSGPGASLGYAITGNGPSAVPNLP